MVTVVLYSMAYAKDKLKLECPGFCDFERFDNILDTAYTLFNYSI